MDIHSSIQLVPFAPIHFDTLISWIHTEKELIQFAGPTFSFPLTPEQLYTHNEEPNRKSYAIYLISSYTHIGHGEIRQKSRSQVDLTCLLIGPNEYRGKGYGKKMVKALLSRAIELFSPKEVRLKVYTWNEAAIRCYEGVGFQIDPQVSYETPFQKEIWKAHEMVFIKLNHSKS